MAPAPFPMHAVPLQLAPGSDLRRGLEEFAVARQASGFVLGVVGDLSRAAFQCPGQPRPSIIEGDLEIITLNGTLSPDGVHLHLSLSDGGCQVWGGHLEPGTVVRKGAELLVGLFAAHSDASPTATSAATSTAIPAAPAVAAPTVAAPPARPPAANSAPIRTATAVAEAPATSPNGTATTGAARPQAVEVAVLSGCPYSARAQRLLRTLGIPHQVLLVRSAEERAAIEQRSGRSTLPQVFIDGQAVGGYDALAELHGQGALEPLRGG